MTLEEYIKACKDFPERQLINCCRLDPLDEVKYKGQIELCNRILEFIERNK